MCDLSGSGESYSSDSSRVRLPRDPISLLLSSMARRNISSSSYAPRLFIVARLLVASLSLFLASFLRGASAVEDKGEDRPEGFPRTGR